MSEGLQTAEELRCTEVAEAVTAYLEGVLDDEHRRLMDAHLAGCPGCRAALDQFRTVKELSGRLTGEDVADTDPLVRDRLAATLRAPRRK